MLEQEYIDKRNELKVGLDKSLEILDMEFTQSIRRFKVGDKIKTHYGSTIQIESIGTVAPNSFYNRRATPVVSYRGVQLTKKLVPYKNADKLNLIDDASSKLELVK